MPLPQTPFYFIRHGQSESNRARIMAGAGIDSPLTDLGRQQADEAGRLLAQIENLPKIICHSPMQRAAETAAIINQHLNLPMLAIGDLREHYVGDWEGKPWEEVTRLWETCNDPPNGEAFADFTLLVKGAMRNALTEPAPVLVVAHGGVWQAIKTIYDAEAGYFELDNAVPHYFHPIPEKPLFPWMVQKLTLCQVSGSVLKESVGI